MIYHVEIHFYQTLAGRRPVVDFIESLHSGDQAELIGCLEDLKLNGFDSLRVGFRVVRGKLWELRIRCLNSRYRIFYVVMQNTLISLHAYKKQSQKAPKHEIVLAEKRMREVVIDENAYTH